MGFNECCPCVKKTSTNQIQKVILIMVNMWLIKSNTKEFVLHIYIFKHSIYSAFTSKFNL